MTASDPLHAEAEVLAANERFYTAFSLGDLDAMGEIWAEQASVSCFHPGQQVLLGREKVMRSWSQILRRPPEVPLECRSPRVQLVGSTALVTCYEAAGTGPSHLGATNVFVFENDAWRMVHHHAGPLQRPVAGEPADTTLN